MSGRALAAAAVLGLCAAGCHRYRDDLDDVCHAFERSGHAPEEGLASTTVWLAGRIRTERARALFRDLATSGSPAEWGKSLRAEAAGEGIATCPFADALGVGPVISLPNRQAVGSPGESAVVMSVAIGPKGQLFWGGVEVTRDELIHRIDQELKAAPDPQLVVAADAAVPYAQVVALLDLAKQRGVRKIALGVQPPAAPTPAH